MSHRLSDDAEGGLRDPKRAFLSLPIGGFVATAILATSWSATVVAQATQLIRLPFVGCKQDGQAGPIPAPTGAAKAVRMDEGAAQRLAYYSANFSAENKWGVLAPRGWYCFGSYGSSGNTLYVRPQPINPSNLFAANSNMAIGPVIVKTFRNGDTSGRFSVAAIIGRVFPSRRRFVKSVIESSPDFPTKFHYGPYPNDKLIYISNGAVEYNTPSYSEGLGTIEGDLKEVEPSRGVAILENRSTQDDTPDLLLLLVRIPSSLNDLSPIIIRQFEHDNGASLSAGIPRPAGTSSSLSVAREFYAALASADGNHASGLVVPEKRQSGPFSASALTRFYSSLRAPVLLTAASLMSDGSVTVRYHFTYADGKRCDGAADVKTTERGSERLIEGIHAYSRC